MTAVSEFILNRTSEPRLDFPAPDQATLDRAFACAARAPDHALLRPWRYLVVEGEGREALSELFVSTCNQNTTEAAKLARAPFRAPMIIVGIASPSSHPKVPEVEQVMSAAVAMGFLELALQEAGFGAMWRTGALAYNTDVQKGLGLKPGESIIGFLYTGTVVSAKPPVPRPEVQDFVQRWPQ